MNAPTSFGSVRYHTEMEQGSIQWHQARCGLLTASEMNRILTPTLKVAANDKSRAHVWEIAAQRISNYVEPSYVGDAMLRGHEDEIRARDAYSKAYAPVTEVGFVTNDEWGFTIGCSPDGLVGDDGMIECKSRIQKYQVQTIVEGLTGAIPDEFQLQIQTALLVTGRTYCDFISYSGGLPMVTLRVARNPEIQSAILNAAAAFEAKVAEVIASYNEAQAKLRLIPTERIIEQEMFA